MAVTSSCKNGRPIPRSRSLFLTTRSCASARFSPSFASRSFREGCSRPLDRYRGNPKLSHEVGAPGVLPEAIRLVELRARVPRYQRDMLRELARREGTPVDAVLTRELEGVASAHAEELAGVPGLAMAMRWPETEVTG